MKNLRVKHMLFAPLVFLLLLFPAHGQSPGDIERLLDEKELSCAQAAWFALAAAPGAAAETLDADGAFSAARERGWLPAKAEGRDPVTMGSLSLLIMKAFELKGGLMYRLTGNSRYAYREMRDRGFLGARAYPSQTVSGEQFLEILDYVAAGQEDVW
ncbi:MAG: hypothetical protein FWH38_02985 [Treponema sp.]|nr:hypothetical protein [Treponema sp.]